MLEVRCTCLCVLLWYFAEYHSYKVVYNSSDGLERSLLLQSSTLDLVFSAWPMQVSVTELVHP